MLEENNSQLRLFVQESRNRARLCLDDLGTLTQAAPEERSMAFDRLLRTIRGIGGSARFHAMPQLVRLCQAMESFLGRFRTHLLQARPEFVSVVVLTFKKLAQLLEDPLRDPPLSIDQELLAISAMIAAHADPPEFNLADYPEALVTAVTQGLDFYSLHIPLTGDPEANRQQFLQIKTAVEVVATLVASKPDLGKKFAWRNDLPGGMVRLLLSTVLPGEILHGLIQLPQERIVRLEIPEELAHAVTTEIERLESEAQARAQADAQIEADPLAEAQLGEVEDQTRMSELGEPTPADSLEETQLGEAEAKARQAHLEELRRQEAIREEQRRQAANDEAERIRTRQELERQERVRQELTERQSEAQQRQKAEQSAAQSRKKRWLFGGMAAAALLLVAAQQADLVSLPDPFAQLWSPSTPSKESVGKAASPVKETPATKPSPVAATPPTPEPATPAPREPATVAMTPPQSPPQLIPPAPAATPPSPPPASAQPETLVAANPPVLTAAAMEPPPAPPESRKSETSRFSTRMKEQNNLPDVDVRAAERASRSTASPAVVQMEKPAEPDSWQAEFARYHSPMVRLTQESYETFKPAKNTKHGTLRVKRTADGNMLFSIADMMGHTAMRPKESFKLTAESMTELRLVLQVEKGRAYLFELDRNGEVEIPKAFWTPFSRASKKAVSVSRVVKQGPEGVHMKDLTALTMSYILRTTKP
ncbi:MAG: Hpt domain-containing protein [Magnetococcus sp. YQC-9]